MNTSFAAPPANRGTRAAKDVFKIIGKAKSLVPGMIENTKKASRHGPTFMRMAFLQMMSQESRTETPV